jgi:hypothetical protein
MLLRPFKDFFIGSYKFNNKRFLMSHTVPVRTAWVVVPVPLFALIYGCFLPESPIYLSKVRKFITITTMFLIDFDFSFR